MKTGPELIIPCLNVKKCAFLLVAAVSVRVKRRGSLSQSYIDIAEKKSAAGSTGRSE